MNIFPQKNLNISALKNKWLRNWFLVICHCLKIKLFIFMEHKASIFSSAKDFACMCSMNKKWFLKYEVIHTERETLQQANTTKIYPTQHKNNGSGAWKNKIYTLGREFTNVYTTKIWMAVFLFVQKYCGRESSIGELLWWLGRESVQSGMDVLIKMFHLFCCGRNVVSFDSINVPYICICL